MRGVLSLHKVHPPGNLQDSLPARLGTSGEIQAPCDLDAASSVQYRTSDENIAKASKELV